MKLEIIGSVSSGKTTLARKLSQKYQVPFYEKDNIVWERTLKGDSREARRKETEFLRKPLKTIIGSWKALQERIFRKTWNIVIILYYLI